MREPVWVPRRVVEAVHLDQLREHGGLPGLRDKGLLDAALARPRQKWEYLKEPGIALLAAAYTFALLKNHPFMDGNKRIAFLTMVVFLGLNHWSFAASEAEVVSVIRDVAAGKMTEEELASWINSHITRL